MQPPPVQKPRPPIAIAAWGPLMLKYVARYADAWNGIRGVLEDDLKEVERKNKLLDKYCVEIDRDPQTLRRSYLMWDREAVRSWGPMVMYKSTDVFSEAVERCLGAGITELILCYPFSDRQIPMFEQIAQETIPELRKRHQ